MTSVESVIIPKIPLAAWLGAMRQEVNEAAKAYEKGGAQLPAFFLDDFVIEATVAVEENTVGGGGFTFYIVKADASVSIKNAVTHKLSIRFKPGEGGPMLGEDGHDAHEVKMSHENGE